MALPTPLNSQITDAVDPQGESAPAAEPERAAARPAPVNPQITDEAEPQGGSV